MSFRSSHRWVVPLLAALLAVLGGSSTVLAKNIALTGTAFSSYTTGVVPGNVNDGNYSNNWNNTNSPNGPSDCIGLDLGAPSTIAGIKVYWQNAPLTFTVDVSNDISDSPTAPCASANWVNVYSYDYALSGNQGPPSPLLVDLTSIIGTTQYRYIRIYGQMGRTTSASDWGVNEFEVLDALPAALSGTARDASNNAFANANIQLNGPIPGGAVNPPYQVNSLKVNADGTYSFPNLEPGSYLVTALAPGSYAPIIGTTVTVPDTGTLTQDFKFTTPVQNTAANTGPLPAYMLDAIADAGEANGGNATSAGTLLPSDEMPMGPTGDAVWFTGDPAFQTEGNGLTWGTGSKMPPTLHFWIPPYTPGTAGPPAVPGTNNVINVSKATIPLPPARYTTLYILQFADSGNWDCTAFLNYADNTQQQVMTLGGNTGYHVADWVTAQVEDEFPAIRFDRVYFSTNGAQQAATRYVVMRYIITDPSKVLKSISFTGGQGDTTRATGLIVGYSGDTLDAPGALGTISGTIKAPVSEGGGPVSNANVSLLSYKINTPPASGAYSFRGLPADTYTVSANKPANYPLTSVSVILPAGGNVTQDIQFPGAIPVITDALTNPNLREISINDPAHAADTVNSGFFGDFSATGYGLGAEFMPHGLYSPNTVTDPDPSTTYHNGGTYTDWQHDANAPGALAFDFGDPTITSPVYPGQVGYPNGGTPNTICIHDAEILAPGTNVSNCYMAITGLDGSINLHATLTYLKPDGTFDPNTQVVPVSVSDWYQSPTTSELPYLIMHGRHTVNTGRTPPWMDGVGSATAAPSNIRINALVIPVDKTRVLHDIRFDHGDRQQQFPIVSAISWETATQQPASSDIRVTVKKSDASAAGGAWVVMGPYSTKADSNGVAVFKGVPSGHPVTIGAFLYGQTQQGVAANHVVPAGQKMPTPDDLAIILPAAAPIFVNLPLAYDYDAIAMADMAGDYKMASRNDRGYNGDLMPASNAVLTDPAMTQNIPLLMPHKETGYMNVQRLNGQTWRLAPGNYSALTFWVTGAGVGGFPNCVYNHFTLNYSDGSSDQVQVANHDWVGNWNGPNETTNATYLAAAPRTPKTRGFFYREFLAPDPTSFTFTGLNIRSRRSNGDDETRREISSTNFMQELVPVDASKTLVSISLPPMWGARSNTQTVNGVTVDNGNEDNGIQQDDFTILAVTMEANSIPAEATISGTVTGQPLGETATGPIAMAQVIADDAHMAYTNADGTFTLPHVDPAITSLKVIPLGTGILTRSFPVTLTAGANDVGTLNVGAGQTSIYIVLGNNKIENGIHYVEGVPNGYNLDNTRPKNKANVPDSLNMPVTFAGRQAYQSVDTNGNKVYSDKMYFQVDKGWLFRGKIGDPGTLPSNDGTVAGRPARGMGMDLSTFLMPATPAQNAAAPAGWKVGPHVWVQIEYFDNAKTGVTTSSFWLEYNQMEGWQHSTTTATNVNSTTADGAQSWVMPEGRYPTDITGIPPSAHLQTYRMTNTYRIPQTKNAAGTGNTNWVVPLGSTNTWKTFTYDLTGVYGAGPGLNTIDAFGAYQGGNLETDFRINPNIDPNPGGSTNLTDNPRVIRSIVISLVNPIPQPTIPSATSALRIAAGLLTAGAVEMAADDVNGDGAITVRDAIALLKQGSF